MEVVDVEHTFLLAVGLLMCKKDSDTAKIAESVKNNRIVSLVTASGAFEITTCTLVLLTPLGFRTKILLSKMQVGG